MAATYEPIASTTLGADAASYTFSSIPGTFTDLRLVVVGRSTRTAQTYDSLFLRFNGDTATNYSLTYIYGSGSAAGSGRASSQGRMQIGRFNHSNGNSNPGIVTADIMSYANTNVFKTALGASAASAENWPVARYVGLWRSTSAVTSIEVTVETASLASGATLSLYGIKGA